jgi:hypothetical protein
MQTQFTVMGKDAEDIEQQVIWLCESFFGTREVKTTINVQCTTIHRAHRSATSGNIHAYPEMVFVAMVYVTDEVGEDADTLSGLVGSLTHI